MMDETSLCQVCSSLCGGNELSRDAAVQSLPKEKRYITRSGTCLLFCDSLCSSTQDYNLDTVILCVAYNVSYILVSG